MQRELDRYCPHFAGCLTQPSRIVDGHRFHVKPGAALERAGALFHDAAAPGEGASQFRQVLERACVSTAFQPSSFGDGSDSLPSFGFSLRRCGGVSTWKRRSRLDCRTMLPPVAVRSSAVSTWKQNE
jgi:hypothetical protein